MQKKRTRNWKANRASLRFSLQMVVKMSSSNGSGLALAGSEAASAQTTGGGGPESGTTGSGATVADSNQSDDEHGGDLGSSNDSDSMGFDDDDNGSFLPSCFNLLCFEALRPQPIKREEPS